jgi:hypothetical protein
MTWRALSARLYNAVGINPRDGLWRKCYDLAQDSTNSSKAGPEDYTCHHHHPWFRPSLLVFIGIF